ncbi:MAG: LptF/LptG family permease [Spirochaetaceae bacterium]|nr:LptF/LptG family permease [Spirochaetaceae bacterium]
MVVGMFGLLVALIDLFSNLVRYLNYEVPFSEILIISFFYLPKAISYAIPLSLLFAAAYTLGDLFARNELTSIFAAGIPFSRFVAPLVAIGILASVLSFFFQDLVVIPTMKRKNSLSRTALHQQPRANEHSDVVIKTDNGKLIYQVDYFDTDNDRLSGISIIETDGDGGFTALVRAPDAYWNGEFWILSNALIYREEDGFIRVRSYNPGGIYREHPDTFRRNAVEIESLPVRDARLLIQDLKNAGLPHTAAEADYYRRFSFSAVSFVVMILSISMGGRFKKNIILMSLGTSLVTAVVYYVMEMISMMLAQTGNIPPAVGAWFPVAFFSTAGVLLLGGAKT